MKLTFLSMFLQYYFITCAFKIPEAQAQRNLLELIRGPMEFLRNVNSFLFSGNNFVPQPQNQNQPRKLSFDNLELTVRANNVTIINNSGDDASEFISQVQQSPERSESTDQIPERTFTANNKNDITGLLPALLSQVLQIPDQSKSTDSILPIVTQSISALTKLLLPDLNFLQPLHHAVKRSEESAKSVAVCQACNIGLSVILEHIRHSRNPNSLIQMAQMACPLVPMESQSCLGIIREYGEIFKHILQIRPHLPPDRVCGMYLQFYGCGTSDPHIYWDVLAEMGYSQDKQRGPETPGVSWGSPNVEGETTLKILQLTDIHLDPLYRPGSRAQCLKEVCCRGDQVVEKDKEFEAGYFGDYRFCDLPFHTFENALAHIAETHPDISMIYMTGDLAPHTGIVWKTSRAEVQEIINTCSEMIHKYFPNTPVIPVIGNHDAHPRNLFTPRSVKNEFSSRWVYEVTAKAWSHWLSSEFLETFLYGGFYSKIVNPQLRIIVINNNVCLSTNFWQAVEDRDPYGQLHWLVNQLQEAENTKQNVHILGHVPPNFEMCWNVWSDNYYKIIARFKNTVKAQFFGHTHYDDFGLYYDPIDPVIPISSYFVGASLTPYVNLNPGYKIYIVDGDRGLNSTYDILDHETWIFNLTEANLTPDKAPKWFRLYKAKEIYELENLSPSQLHSFVMRMSNNETYFKEFYRHFYKAAVNNKSQKCDAMCRKSVLCNIVSPTFRDYGRCMLLDNPNPEEILPRAVFSSKRSSAKVFAGFTGLGRNEPWAGLRVIGPITNGVLD